jgi:Flp pilus assembly protein protease CpaA
VLYRVVLQRIVIVASSVSSELCQLLNVVVAICYVASSDVASCVVANYVVASCYVANCMGILIYIDDNSEARYRF